MRKTNGDDGQEGEEDETCCDEEAEKNDGQEKKKEEDEKDECEKENEEVWEKLFHNLYTKEITYKKTREIGLCKKKNLDRMNEK